MHVGQLVREDPKLARQARRIAADPDMPFPILSAKIPFAVVDVASQLLLDAWETKGIGRKELPHRRVLGPCQIGRRREGKTADR